MANSESFIMEVIAQAEAQGVDATVSALVSLQKQVDQLARHTGMAEKDLRKLSSAFESVSSAAAAGGGGVAKQTSKFEEMRKTVNKLNQEISETATRLAESGDFNPRASTLREYEDDPRLAEAKAVLEAEKTTVDSIVAEWEKGKREKARIVSEQERLYNDYLEKQYAYEKNVREKQERLYNDYLEHQHRATQKAQQGTVPLDAHVQEYEKQLDQQEKASQQTALYNQYLWEEEQALKKSTAAVREQSASLPTLRYALYDVAQTAGTMATAIAATGTALIAASASYESSFTAVERTTGAVGSDVETLRGQFLQLSREIPQTFSEIADIGARGAQLGVANDQLSDFTETVAQFVATSDTVSLEQAVEAFGRVSNLLGDTDFNRIGSAITLVGVNAAATEAQIVKTTQELAPFATAVGLSTDEVIALAAALGSLGQPPERARSAFLTLQRVMDNAVSSGSENLSAFAALLGQTEEQVAALWKQDPGQFIESFSSALGSVEDLTATFEALGINERRAVQVFQALASDSRNAGDGVSVLSQAMADANRGYTEGTEMARQYGLIVDDLASKWQLFLNSVAEFAATAGNAIAPLAKQLLDVVTWVVQGLANIASNPIGAFVIQLSAGVGGLVFVATSLIATIALAAASFIALRTALTEAAIAGGRVTTSAVAARLSLIQLAGAAAQASGAVTTFNRVARTALAGTGIGLALLALGAAWEAVDAAINRTSRTFEKFFGTASGLEGALSQDTAAYAEALEAGNRLAAESFTVIEASSASASEAMSENQRVADAAARMMGIYRDNTSGAAGATDQLTIALGANTLEWMKNTLAQSDAFRQIAANADFQSHLADLVANGFQMDEFLTIARDSGSQAALAYLEGFENVIDTSDFDWAEQVAGREEFLTQFGDLANAAAGLGDEIAETEAVNRLLGISMEETSESVEGLSESLWDQVSILFDSINAQNALSGSLGTLGEEYVNSGAAAAFSGDAMQAAMENIVNNSSGAGEAAANLQVLYDFILKNTAATAQDLILLAQAIDLLEKKGGKKSPATLSLPDFDSFSLGVERANAALSNTRSAGGDAARGVREARKEVRTLLDYASDLSKVWSRAFDIRFSGQSTLDSITSTFLSIRQAADDAARRIRDLNNDIRGLASDIDIQEYFLSIAVEYGDTQRAEAIEADLAKMRAELADKTAELQKEQDANSKSLVGNSKGAIENRKQITSLVQQYQAHIEALAASGMSQDDLARATARLRQDFINQATQLGYNRKELEVYARAFDDVSVAISKVPRNITVTANTNPAIQAFNEYATRANDALNSIRANAGKAINFAPIGNPNNAKELRRMALEAEMLVHARNATELSAAGGAANMQGARLSAYAAAQIRAQLASGNYYTGGYTGSGGKYEPAGIVHKGEYVIPKHMVNQTTGLPYADALGRLMGGVRGYASGGATSGSGAVGTQQVALTAGTIQAIANATGKVLVLDGQVIADSSARIYSEETTVGAY